MKSLRSRILLAAGSTIAVCWAVSLVTLSVWLERRQSSIVDDELNTVAISILLHQLQAPDGDQGGKGGQAALARLPALTQPTKHGLDPRLLAYQVWADRSTLLAHAEAGPRTALQASFAEGFANAVVGGQRWRVNSVPDRTGRFDVQVGVPQNAIDAELRRRAFTVLGTASVLLMLVSVFMWCAVRKALLPVADMEARLHRRQKFDLTPLSFETLPTELHPLVGAFNHVLHQLDDAVEGERRFIGDAAHELRTPLAALLAQAQVAMRATTLAEKDAALGKLLAVAERSIRLSEQLLDLARLNAGANAPQQSLADLSELAEYVCREFDMQAHQQQRSLLLDLQPCTIVCNIDEIGILLRNLVDNALRYTASDGRVRIACGIQVTGQVLQSYLEVADDGPGVPDAEREAIFKRFHRVPGSTVRGSGIGLSLVAGIAQLHRATITTGTGLGGRGLCVRVLFPPARDSAGH